MKQLILLLLFIPLVAFGQISMSDLIKVSKMDLENFEIYGLEKGYRFGKISNEEDVNWYGLQMKKTNGQRTEFLTNYQKMGFKGERGASYQGPMQERLATLYKEIKSLGFELSEMNEFESDGKIYLAKDYKKNNELINIYVYPDGVNIEISYTYNL